MIEYIQKITDNSIVIIISLLSNVVFTVSSIFGFIKLIKKQFKKVKLSNRLRLLLILILFIFCGLISPILLLVKSFSDWSGLYFWSSQVLAWYVLYTFVSISYWIIKFEIELKQLKS